MKKNLTLFLLVCLFTWQTNLHAQVCFESSICGQYDFLVFTTGVMLITATGADGGDAGFNFGGSGGKVQATFNVVAGNFIRVIIGCAGESDFEVSGGGGGTAVMNCGFSVNNCNMGFATELVIVGGGGGAFDGIFDGASGGGASNEPGIGFGGSANGFIGGGGGGGVFSNGLNGFTGDGGGQATFTNISPGGQPTTIFGTQSGAAGGPGFGGGGGAASVGRPDRTAQGAGGGGGFSGGSGQQSVSYFAEGGTNLVGSSAVTVFINESGFFGGGNAASGSVKIECLGPLKVDYTAFKGSLKGGHVLLEWNTSNEQENAGFEIQKLVDYEQSVEDGTWEVFGFVEGYGTTTEAQQYQWIDEKPVPDVNYYRLRQINLDGSYEYSQSVSVFYDPAQKHSDIQIFPNPVQDIMYYQAANIEQVERILLFDVNGKLLQESKVINGQLSLTGLPKGLYLFVLEKTSGRMQRRIVKE